MELSILEQIMHLISEAARLPVILILLLFFGFSLFSIGWILAEGFNERRYVMTRIESLLDEFREKSGVPLENRIKRSGLLSSHKRILLELTRHPDFSRQMLESLADHLIEEEQVHYDRVLGVTNLVARLSPMFGLLGTLIPLGPGIIALGNGDTGTLARSMLTAFDTTVIGLLSCGICIVVTVIRRRWYDGYMSGLQTLADCVTEAAASRREDS